MVRLSSSGKRSRKLATEARTQLEHDSAKRAEHVEAIEYGREARTRVTEVLSARLIEAVDGNIPLPLWFTDVLGATPSPGEPVRWWESAVSLLAYRMTFRISDPSRALGSRPGPSACARQRQWFGELDRDLFARPLCRPGNPTRGGR
jgi:hypothetical protein